MLRKFVFILFICCFQSLLVQAQLTTVGKEFWLGFMENNRGPGAPDIAKIIISANEDAKGVIDVSNLITGLSITFDLKAGERYVYSVPSTDMDFMHRSSGVVEKKGIYILSDGNISVYAFNERIRSADGTVVLPITTLGKDYWITSHFEEAPEENLNNNNESLLLVVGVENDTRVRIIPSVATENGDIAGVPYEITLDAGESYQLKARGDLTGSRVTVIGTDARSCKNIAVFGGNKWSGVGQCGSANDHLFQQIYPVNTWGNEFIHVPLAGRTSGDLVKVLASENNTEVVIDGVLETTLNAGQFASYDFEPQEVLTITTSKPSSVTVFSKSQACNDQNQPATANVGDPFMITYSPNQQLLTSVTFEAVSVQSIEVHYVNVIVDTNANGAVTLNGNNISPRFRTVPGNPAYSYAQIKINEGTHILRNEAGFIAYVYGFGNIESYGYSVGASLENLNFEISPEYNFEVNGQNVACLDQEAVWKITPENEAFTFFEWDFGTGDALLTGEEVAYTFKEQGTYTVKVRASLGQDGCDQQEEISFEVEVLGSEATIEGVSAVCPFEQAIPYSLSDMSDISRVEWSVQGGTIVEQSDQSIAVDWGDTNDDATVTAVLFTLSGCPLPALIFDVKVNERLEPGLPDGPLQICFDPTLPYTYSAADILLGRAYQWYVTNGTIVGDSQGVSIDVLWDMPDITGEVWYEEFSLTDATCQGTSDKLMVQVGKQFEFKLLDVNAVLCNGETQGQIITEVVDGNGALTFNWSHDPTLNSPVVSDLPSGVYTVSVTDEFGCIRSIEDIVVSEPDELELMIVEEIPVSCFGGSDGQAIIEIRGGTLPYTASMGEVNGQILRIGDLTANAHDVVVTDANGCQIQITFNIATPPRLTARAFVTKQACPNIASGIIEVEILGGVAPYFITWDFENRQGVIEEEVGKGVYTAMIQDANGCIVSTSVEMTERSPIVRMPTGFRPSDGGVNAIYQGVATCDLSFTLLIYNRWGELIFSGDSIGWDGRINGAEAEEGSYSYKMEYVYEQDGQLIKKALQGTFTLLR